MARELAPAGLRSSPILRAASRPNGSKLPRHGISHCLLVLCQLNSACRFFIASSAKPCRNASNAGRSTLPPV
ncbi:hypothetical protein FW800_20535 [Pseudomonas sp. 910_23]|uniref:Uncharacterized protein n=1 Tax=Pseudomonas synxantha TaxID=47883 RepID=A0A5D3GDQ9_9PSED|nr:hypothetical protein FXO26_05645 [Pseudomonas synxantha]